VVVVGATNHPELLDRAAWRRFQVRLNLPQPKIADIGEWFIRFENRIGVTLGISPVELAKKLAGCSFSDIEEFGTTIYREYVLNQPGSNIKAITNKTLKQWPYRATRASKS
jgi:SpoVK/Ycf46/Vps4 family AAA+-type ATPase